MRLCNYLFTSMNILNIGMAIFISLIFSVPNVLAKDFEITNKYSMSNGLRLDSNLLLKSETNSGPNYLSGDQIEGQIDDLIVVKNNAQLRRMGMSLKADKLQYDLVEGRLDAIGNVSLFREGELYLGPRLVLSPATMQGFFEKVSYDFSRINGRGYAEKVEFVQHREIILENATFTTCSTQRPAWEVRSKSILVDDIRSVAEARSSALFWNNSQVLPLGDISFSISGKRKTGLLAPTFSVNSKLGLDLTTPYYINLAPNRDITLYPRIVGRRGVQLGTEYRFLNKKQAGEIGLQLLPTDRITNKDRWLARVSHTFRLSSNNSFGLSAIRVSDNNYFADFGASVLAASQRILPATVQINGNFQGWQYLTMFQKYQVLQDPGAPILPPYEWSPRIRFSNNRILKINKLDIDASGIFEMTHFTHPSMAEGTRIVGDANFSSPLLIGGVRLMPQFGMHLTSYSHSKNGSQDLTQNRFGIGDSLIGVYANNVGHTPSYTRILPSISIEASSILERGTEFKEKKYTHTLEPKLFYAFTPFTDQSSYPVFDSSSITSSLAQLLSENSFFGSDRIADKNYVTAALTTRLFESSGYERLRASVAQRYYFDQQRVVLPGQPVRSDNESDLFFETAVKVTKDISVTALGQYTRKLALWQSQIVGLRYSPKPGNSFSFDYRFTRDSVDSADFAFQSPILKNWYAVGRYNYSFQSRSEASGNQPPGLVEALFGLEYDGGCWVSRFVAQRYVTGATQSTNAFFFQIELNGIARVGADPLSALKRGIPNYKMINHLTPLPATYENFQ